MATEEENAQRQGLNIHWLTVLWYIHLHYLSLCGLWMMFTDAKWMTLLCGMFTTMIACIGVTVGMHRYYAHKTFVATTPLRFFFVLAHTLSGVGTVYNWVLLHRIHHKHFGTDKDPYNFNKGFIHSHFLSNCTKDFLKNDDLTQSIDMRDVQADKFAWIQYKFYWILFIFVTLIIPIYVPMEYWNESFANSVLIMGVLRLAIAFNVAALVNSAIHVWGLKPTDKFPVDDYSVFWVSKSYWPNYHYIFPRDWKSSEFGKYDTGCGTILIKLYYELGLVDTLTTMSSENIREILYELACKKISMDAVTEKLETLSMSEAIRQNLCFKH